MYLCIHTHIHIRTYILYIHTYIHRYQESPAATEEEEEATPLPDAMSNLFCNWIRWSSSLADSVSFLMRSCANWLKDVLKDSAPGLAY
jgi:hypothetical protein